EKIVSLAAVAGLDRIRIAGSDVVEVQLRIVSAGYPGHAAAVAHGIFIWPTFRAWVAFLQRLAPPFPLDHARFRIVRFEEAGDIERIATCADDYVIAHNDRRGRGEIFLLNVGDFHVPALLASSGLERDKVVIGSLKEQPIAIHAHAAIADVNAARGLPEVMPQLAARPGVHGPGIIGSGEIEDAVHH